MIEKRYDLEERTEAFSKAVISLCNDLPKSTVNLELISQVVRSAGSVGANYIEANERLSQKDFVNRIKICRKEARETRYWLRLIAPSNSSFETQLVGLAQEATELMDIFGAILKKST